MGATLSSDNVYNLAIDVAESGPTDAEFRAKLVAELIRSAIELKNLEIHAAVAHAAEPVFMRGGGGSSH